MTEKICLLQIIGYKSVYVSSSMYISSMYICYTIRNLKIGFSGMFVLLIFQFNLAIKDIPEVTHEAKKALAGQLPAVGRSMCVEISLKTSEVRSSFLLHVFIQYVSITAVDTV